MSLAFFCDTKKQLQRGLSVTRSFFDSVLELVVLQQEQRKLTSCPERKGSDTKEFCSVFTQVFFFLKQQKNCVNVDCRRRDLSLSVFWS